MGIEILSKETAALLSVHQIVPDPYILVKELVENSLDSGSTRIKIGICGEKEDLSFIVQDNGEGIEVNEHFLAMGGTSKIQAPTYGCKGIALYALSQLGDMYINTRRRSEELSTEITSIRGKVQKAQKYKPDPGTTIKISNFHKASPVRCTYIGKNIGVYLKDIVALAKKCFVAHGTEFSIERNGKTVFSSKKQGGHASTSTSTSSTLHRLVQAYGAAEGLGSFCIETEGLVIEGLLLSGGAGVEGVMQAGGRIVESSKLLAAMSTLGKHLQTKLIYSMRILHEHPSESTERTNIGSRSNKHHRLVYKEALLVKEIEGLRHAQEIKKMAEAVQRQTPAVSFTNAQEITPTWAWGAVSISRTGSEKPAPHSTKQQTSTQACTQTRSSQETEQGTQAGKQTEHIVAAHVIDGEEHIVVKECRAGVSLQKADIAQLRVIGQFNNGFILASFTKDTDTFTYVIDQHSADEAVNYERLKVSHTYSRQRLISPLAVSLSAYEQYLAEEHTEALAQHGFVFSEDKCALAEVPVYEHTFFGEKELHEVLEAIKDEKPLPIIFSSLRKLFASKACRSSIMIGDVLSHRQMQSILDNLGKTTRPWNCPHGRPTIALLQAPVPNPRKSTN
ncbi:DNA mismatch repair protein PMS2 [Nematocida sp. AWRm77]|nr:DNA mismatch repair protein PMS2 [Nematocida sp. AWRm77]